jgi:hypothetical protein
MQDLATPEFMNPSWVILVIQAANNTNNIAFVPFSKKQSSAFVPELLPLVQKTTDSW